MNLNLNSTVKELSCKHCDLRFLNKAIMITHSKLLHEKSEDTKAQKNKLLLVSLICYNRKQYKCKVCDNEFIQKHAKSVAVKVNVRSTYQVASNVNKL